MTINNDKQHRFMQSAIDLAGKAHSQGEFPVGCVITYRQQIVATGARINSKEGSVNELDHAEINALREFSRLTEPMIKKEATLYCTLEPCLMCYAAIALSGIGNIVYAYEDAMGGGTSCNMQTLSPLYRDNTISITSGIMRNESIALFQEFFSDPKNVYWKESYLSKYTMAQHIEADCSV